MKIKQIVILTCIVICFEYKAYSQTLRLIDFYEKYHNVNYQSTDFPSLGFRRSIEDTFYYKVSSIKNDKLIIKVPKVSIFEVFENRYLLISTKSNELFSNSQPDFTKPRDSVFIIDLTRKGLKRHKVYVAALNGKRICSNALELIITNKGFVYDYAVRSISLVSNTLELLNLKSLKTETLSISSFSQ